MKINTNGFSSIQIHLIGMTLFLLIAAGSTYAVYSSWDSHQSGIESSQLQLTQVSEDLSTAQRDRGRLISKIANLNLALDDHDSIIQPNSINELAVQIVALAEKHSLELEQFEPSPPTTLNQEAIQPISMRLKAPYQAVSEWLNELHTTMPDIHVVGISIVSQNATAESVSSNIRLNWYIPTSDQPTQ